MEEEATNHQNVANHSTRHLFSRNLGTQTPLNLESSLSYLWFCSSISSPFSLPGFEMETKDKMNNEELAVESPTSVLEDEDVCAPKDEVQLEEELIANVINDGSSLVSKTMAEEEAKLLNARIKEEEVQCEEAPDLNDTQFNKLDELLTQTKLYSEFLLEKMDDITLNVGEQVKMEEQESNPSAKRGRGSKRKAASQCNTRRAKRAVAAMLTRSKEGEGTVDMKMTEEERVEKEQKELMPLLTGGKLKPYQLKGVKWLISLWQNGLNGILADQMGLGKTIQTIGFLSHLKAKGLDGPYMIIAPLSTLSNWVNEISRFAPSLRTIIYHGDKKERDEIRRKFMPRTIGPKFPIVLTSYEVALNDAKKYLRPYSWKYLVIDEGHRLKNSQCKLVKALKYLTVENKLLLTGTPLQNNLAELWSLLNFILPDIFASLEEFESWFNLSAKGNNEANKEELEEKRRSQVVAKLHAILRPFLLRRPLPASALRNLAIQLRKVCNHPDLIDPDCDHTYLYPPVNEIVEQCGKFHLLDRLVQRLFARNHKVLVFSQWTKVLDIIDYYFSEKGFEVCRIDGSVKLDDRKRQIHDFNDENSNCRVFLLSTRAGGLGINLTAADTCILYDSDWNPQVDLQAMDRCHRIGQTKPVHIYRLSTAQSIEDRMLKRAFSKLKLEHVVIGKGQFHQERKAVNTDQMEEEDVLALLRDDETDEDKMIRTDISDEDLEKLMDRSDLIVNNSDDSPCSSFPLKGPGWEVVIPTATGGVLSTLNS
ncbi:hypothetical protein V8G54_016298 [Vigna mungo]|uniref:ATP-dependent DNA helicase DDM1 n=1 Tax=Vigna mungo TaxID=3915 RepID=A0AAQ3NNQ4_VIGMU